MCQKLSAEDADNFFVQIQLFRADSDFYDFVYKSLWLYIKQNGRTECFPPAV